MHPGAAKKLDKFFLQFYPLKELFFSWLPRFPELGFNRQLHTKASPELRLNRQSISDLQTHIGGHHPILYFKSQITQKYSIVLYYFPPWLNLPNFQGRQNKSFFFTALLYRLGSCWHKYMKCNLSNSSLFSTWLENGAPILNFHSLKEKSKFIKVSENIHSSF